MSELFSVRDAYAFVRTPSWYSADGIAERLGLSLARISGHFRDLDAVADAWFGRARHEMLRPVPPEFAGLPARQRLETLLLRWFDATSAHRRVSVRMLAAKMWPFHPHHWVPLIFELSRTVLWLRDAARLMRGVPAETWRR